MRKTFIDSSAYAKVFIIEAGSAELIRFMNSAQEPVAPSALVRVEVRSAIRRRQSMQQLSRNDSEVAIALLSLDARNVQENAIDVFTLREAALLVDRRSLRTLDAIQLASALPLLGNAPGEPPLFIVSDLKLQKAAEAEGFLTWNPADGPCVL